jgi:hypothetical protein
MHSLCPLGPGTQVLPTFFKYLLSRFKTSLYVKQFLLWKIRIYIELAFEWKRQKSLAGTWQTKRGTTVFAWEYKNKTVKGIKMAADSRSRQPLLEIFDDFKMADEHERPFRGSRHTYSSLQKVKSILFCTVGSYTVHGSFPWPSSQHCKFPYYKLLVYIFLIMF